MFTLSPYFLGYFLTFIKGVGGACFIVLLVENFVVSYMLIIQGILDSDVYIFIRSIWADTASF